MVAVIGVMAYALPEVRLFVFVSLAGGIMSPLTKKRGNLGRGRRWLAATGASTPMSDAICG